jgi:hypothetical protein
MRGGNKFASADETIVAGFKAWRLAQPFRVITVWVQLPLLTLIT